MSSVVASLNLQTVHQVIDLMLNESKQLKDAVAACGFTLGEFKRYVDQDKEAKVALASAWGFQAHVLVDEARHIADTSTDAAKARNQIDIRKWMAERRDRRSYGQQLDISVTQTIDVGSTLAEARARILRPVRDQLTQQDAQVLDVPARMVACVGTGTLPAQSDEAAPPLEPDIFS